MKRAFIFIAFFFVMATTAAALPTQPLEEKAKAVIMGASQSLASGDWYSGPIPGDVLPKPAVAPPTMGPAKTAQRSTQSSVAPKTALMEDEPEIDPAKWTFKRLWPAMCMIMAVIVLLSLIENLGKKLRK
jgi:hypothetical protein